MSFFVANSYYQSIPGCFEDNSTVLFPLCLKLVSSFCVICDNYCWSLLINIDIPTNQDTN